MPYIACPACSERIGISKISFAFDAEAQFFRTIELDDKPIWCPHCKEKYIISTYVAFLDVVPITSGDYTYDDLLDVKWNGEGASALEYYEEEEED